MVDIEWVKQRESEIASRVKERLENHLDLLERLQEAILYGVGLIMESSQRIDFEIPKDRFAFLSIICASRIVALVRSSTQLCFNGYALDAAILARSLYEISISYQYLLSNRTEADLFAEDKISPGEIIKRALKGKKSDGEEHVGALYGVLSEFAHHSQWALSHILEWEESERTFVTFRILVEDPEIVDPPLRHIFQSGLRFYEHFYKFVIDEFRPDEEWEEQRAFILEYQDIFQSERGDDAPE